MNGCEEDEKSRLHSGNHSIHCNNSGIPYFNIWSAIFVKIVTMIGITNWVRLFLKGGINYELSSNAKRIKIIED